jgi:hypothetical protein
MLRIFITRKNLHIMYKVFLIIALFIPSLCFSEVKDTQKKPKLQKPIRTLYSHKKHDKPFKNLNVKCLDCHRFSIKTVKRGPLAPPIKQEFLKPETDICHQCHLGRVSTPRRHQCTLCHIKLDSVKPKDHFISWSKRHGKISQFNRDSCTQCHKRSECSTCHIQRDQMKPTVHPGNFRFTHSIKARFNPKSCITCHQTAGFCRKCHYDK